MRYTWRTLVYEILVLIVAAVFCVPFYFLIAMALKPSGEVFTTSPIAWPQNPDPGNFSHAWGSSSGGGGIGEALVSSLIITVSTVLILVVFGSLCAWVLARRPGKLSSFGYFLAVLGIVIPFQLSVIPLYAGMRQIGLIGTYPGMIMLWVGFGTPLAIFLYTGFIRQIPKDYEEAARVDGAGPLRTFFSIVFPLLRPVTGSVAIMTGLFCWNDFFVSLVFLGGSQRQTLPVAIYSFVGEYVAQWNYVFAAVIVALVPVVVFFVVAQKQLIKGFAGGLKA
jgi:raffinose/stachyose/melibiose transport system permease protein